MFINFKIFNSKPQAEIEPLISTAVSLTTYPTRLISPIGDFFNRPIRNIMFFFYRIRFKKLILISLVFSSSEEFNKLVISCHIRTLKWPKSLGRLF